MNAPRSAIPAKARMPLRQPNLSPMALPKDAPIAVPNAVIAPTIPIDRLLSERGAVRAMAVMTHTKAGR